MDIINIPEGTDAEGGFMMAFALLGASSPSLKGDLQDCISLPSKDALSLLNGPGILADLDEFRLLLQEQILGSIPQNN